MDEYIEYVADCLLAFLDVPPRYGTLNPVRHGLASLGRWIGR